MKLIQFLMRLNDMFQPIRSSVLSRETLPDVKDAFEIFSREESYRGITSSFSSGSGPNPNFICKNCGKVGHTVDRCFDLIGYPPGYNKNPVQRNLVLRPLMLILSLPPMRMVRVASLIAMYSGANQHMTISTANMFGIIDITDLNLTVGHPNEYYVGILSVNKLIRDSRMFVGFTESKLYIQDLHVNKIVETNSENGSLYMFDSPSPISSNFQTIEASKSKTGQSKKETQSSSAKDKSLSHHSPPTPVVGEMHKEEQQAAGGPTSLGPPVKKEPTISSVVSTSGYDASADSIAEADPRLSAPNDFIPSQQGMGEGTKNY
ncbi:ribonuclease H-like domain-containing protein [Tanacetum coccineum]